MNKTLFTVAILATFILTGPAAADVLGPCGTAEADSPAAVTAPAAESTSAAAVSRLPMPGDQAPNFELDAVVGDEVKKIKLSDYDGKWRVVCFYPADFTFV